MRTKEMWEEILFPMRLKSGKMLFRYMKHEGDLTHQYLAEYNFETKKWLVAVFEYKMGKMRWDKRRGDKRMRHMIIQKAIRFLEREMKQIRREEIVERTT